MHRIPAPEYFTRRYENFRGVDFSSDHTEVRPDRLPFALNMYKDYKSGQGKALESFTGFSKKLKFDGKINGIHKFSIKGVGNKIFVHAGTKLYLWYNFPLSVNVIQTKTGYIDGTEFILDTPAHSIEEITINEESIVSANYYISSADRTKIIFHNEQLGNIKVSYYEGRINEVYNSSCIIKNAPSAPFEDVLLDNKSTTFQYGEKLYFCSGGKYSALGRILGNIFILRPVYDKLSMGSLLIDTYTPTTFINRIPAQNAISTTGVRLEQRNLLSPYFKNSFISPVRENYELSLKLEDYTSSGVVSSNSVEVVAPTTEDKQKIELTVELSAGSITNAGKCELALTSYRFASIEYIYLDLVEEDTANTVAEKIISELKNRIRVTTYYNISGSDNLIVLEDKELASIVTTYQLSENNLDVEYSFNQASQLVFNPNSDEVTLIDNPYRRVLEINNIYRVVTVEEEDEFILIPEEEYELDETETKIIFTEVQTDNLSFSYKFEFQSDVEVEVYGEPKTLGLHYDIDREKGIITFHTPPTRPEDNGFPVNYDGIKVRAKKTIMLKDKDGEDKESWKFIDECTILCEYDNRVFFSGNPDYPSQVWFCMLNDPTYIGELNFFVDGKGLAPITGMMTVADTLMVLKADTTQDSSIYFHTALDTESDFNPRIYPSQGGKSNLGCLGACINFLDDPVYISRLGLEGVGQRVVTTERAIEHRSSMIDGRFVNEDLSECLLEEWGGYLLCMINGKIYMADSRQVYQDELGNMQYEWYYIEGLGIYDNQYKRYDYADSLPEHLEGYEIEQDKPIKVAPKGLKQKPANYPDNNGEPTLTIEHAEVSGEDVYYVKYITTVNETEYYDYYLVEPKEDYIGGVLSTPTTIKNYNDNILFGTENGYVCAFHFDKRNEYGEIPAKYYHFDNRVLISGAATVFDNCNVPNMLKTTVKKSLVVKCRSLPVSSMQIKVRTNKSGFRFVGEVNNGMFNFEDVNFSNLTFNTSNQQIFMVNEREKKWVEKQFFLYNDKPMTPFALHYLIYQYTVVGRVK